MKTLILGCNGFIGTALYHHLEKQGHAIYGVDNNMREANVNFVGSRSLTPRARNISYDVDITDYEELFKIIEKVKPDTIVHLAHQPSAPFSMIGPKFTNDTQRNNVLGTLNVLWAIKEINPKIHLVVLGTAGEYAADLWNNKKIPEGARLTVQHEGSDWEIPTPRYAGSFYHWSKVFNDFNIDYACKIWGLRATNIQQGIVYGHRHRTRFDYDYFFGTVVHRFVTQAVARKPLTVYGTGGQTRGFICLQNSIEAIELLANNPAKQGEFRVIHQSTEEYSVMDIAKMVRELTGAKIKERVNPRVELEENKFEFVTDTLDNLGLKTIPMEEELPKLIELVSQYKGDINKKLLSMKESITWR
jgi:UDP-sulfoquinovose synthase